MYTQLTYLEQVSDEVQLRNIFTSVGWNLLFGIDDEPFKLLRVYRDYFFFFHIYSFLYHIQQQQQHFKSIVQINNKNINFVHFIHFYCMYKREINTTDCQKKCFMFLKLKYIFCIVLK